MADHLRMIISLDESKVRALHQVCAILDGTESLDLVSLGSPCHRRNWVASVLHRFRYRRLKRADRGLLLRYIRHIIVASAARMSPGWCGAGC